MRIAVFHNLPPGGAKRVLYEFLRRTADRYDYELFRIDLGRADRWPGSRGVLDVAPFVRQVHEYRMRSVPRMVRALAALQTEQCIRLQRRIAHDIDAAGFDMAFVHHEQFTSTPALLAHLRTPSVYYMQEPRRRSFEYAARPLAKGVLGPAWSAYEWSLRRREIAWARRADLVLCNSAFSAESIARAYGIDAKVSKLGVDPELFELCEAPRRRRVLSVGALDPMKAHELAVEAVARVPAAMRPELCVVGDRGHGEYRSRLEQRARTLGVQLTVLESIRDRQLVELYGTSAATLCISRLEPLGLTALESMACGTPVIAVREGGFRETVQPGRGGLLVERDAQAVAGALSEVLADPSRWPPQRVRENAVPQWSWDGAVQQLEEHFAEFMAARRKGETSALVSDRADAPEPEGTLAG